MYYLCAESKNIIILKYKIMNEELEYLEQKIRDIKLFLDYAFKENKYLSKFDMIIKLKEYEKGVIELLNEELNR